jgi:glyoxylase-like metal-dependent hydrolase (beta-lactamase superfamily II)
MPAASVETESIAGELKVVHGAVNGAFLQQNGKTLAVYGDPQETGMSIDTVLFTQARRDVVWAGRLPLERGAKSIVPALEADLFTKPSASWSDFEKTRFHDYQQRSSKVLADPLPASRLVRGGEAFDWEGIPIRVLDTPGYTRGAVTYLLRANGKLVAFTGDLIYGDGKLLDLYSLQDGIPEAKIGGYHGYAARLAEVIASLRKVAAEKPDILVPARGPIINDPQGAIATLIQRIQAVYANYLSIDALRWYFGDDHIRTKAKRVLGETAQIDWMSMAETIQKRLPDWLTAFSNSRLIRSADGSGFLIDCGGQSIIGALQKLRQAGTLASLDHVFITHYHDDHTDQIPALVSQFGCTVYATRELWDVLEHPAAYRLPCLTANPITVTDRLDHQAKWSWKEFDFTAFYFPGQTILHDALLVQKRQGESILFVGDSFTPSGIDDYCLQNRNFLHEGTGFFYCLNLLKQMPPDCLLVNQHVEPAFRFSPAQLERLRSTLEKRVELLKTLFPWDDPNFGLDEGWARFYPYGSETQKGAITRYVLNLMNHSPKEQAFEIRVHLPKGWTLESISPNPLHLPAAQSGVVDARVRVPADAAPGNYLITADLHWGEWDLREWTEAMVSIAP